MIYLNIQFCIVECWKGCMKWCESRTDQELTESDSFSIADLRWSSDIINICVFWMFVAQDSSTSSAYLVPCRCWSGLLISSPSVHLRTDYVSTYFPWPILIVQIWPQRPLSKTDPGVHFTKTTGLQCCCSVHLRVLKKKALTPISTNSTQRIKAQGINFTGQ